MKITEIYVDSERMNILYFHYNIELSKIKKNLRSNQVVKRDCNSFLMHIQTSFLLARSRITFEDFTPSLMERINILSHREMDFLSNLAKPMKLK